MLSLLCSSTTRTDYRSLATRCQQAVPGAAWPTSAVLTVYHYRYVKRLDFICFFNPTVFVSINYNLLCHKTGRCWTELLAFTALEEAGVYSWQRYF